MAPLKVLVACDSDAASVTPWPFPPASLSDRRSSPRPCGPVWGLHPCRCLSDRRKAVRACAYL